MTENYYLYRFLDSNNNVIYIGRTNCVDRRLNEEHFTDTGNIPPQGYNEVEKIEYVILDAYSQQIAFEAILIATVKPKYNVEFNDNGMFDFKLPDLKWIEYECNIELLKKRNSLLHMAITNQYQHKKILCTGYEKLDKSICLCEGSLTLLAGVSQSYKTALALNICNNIARQKHKVLYINLKDSAETLIIKLLALDAIVSRRKMLNQELSDEDWTRISQTSSKLSTLELFFSSKAYDKRNIYDIVGDISCDLSLVIVDDVYSIDTDNIYGKDKTHNIMRILKAIAIDKKVPIIAIVPISNKIGNRSDSRPILSDFDYDSLISYSDNIVFTHYLPTHDQNNVMDIIVAKSNYDDVLGIIHLAVNNDRIFNIEAK